MFFKYLFFNHIFIYIYGKTFNSVASVWQLVARLRGGCSLVENSPNFFIAIFDLFNFATLRCVQTRFDAFETRADYAAGWWCAIGRAFSGEFELQIQKDYEGE